MEKLNKKDYFNLLIILLPATIFLLIIFSQGYIFGSKIDWISQHYAIPEYFRNLFYQGGNLFPTFAKNLGLGQNIFYFSYYGLFSPIILASYLLPFIPMHIYVQIISIICYFLSIYFMYKWLKNKFNLKTTFMATFIFALSGPLFFHAHRHFMFVIYLPFLIKSLMLIDEYFQGNKKTSLLIINVLLMILTSYYYSISGILVIGIYSIYKVIETKKTIKVFYFKPVIKIIFLVCVSIMISAILLLPTAHTLNSGRLDTAGSIKFFNLIFSKLKFNLTFYHAYSLGLTFIYVFSLMYVYLQKKKENIFLGIILLLCMIVPLVSYILNGFMYIDGKIFIPFLPLTIIIISNFITDLYQRKINLKKLFILMIPITSFMIYSALGYINFYFLIADILLMLVVIYLAYKKEIKICLLIFLAPFLTFLTLNLDEQYVRKTDIKNLQAEDIKYLLKEIPNTSRLGIIDNSLENVNRIYDLNQNSSNIYSSSANMNYANLVRKVFQNEIINKDKATYTQSQNILFNIYTGTKYLITKDKSYLGYIPIQERNNLTLNVNEDVLPIIYYSPKIMSKREYLTLKYPYNIEAMLNYIIVDEELDNVYESQVQEIDLKTEIIKQENLSYEVVEDGISMQAAKNNQLILKINNDLNNKVLIIKFKMAKEKSGYGCSSEITINGITNSLSCSRWKYHNDNYTFEYVLANSEPLKELKIEFSEDIFLINEIETYVMEYEKIKEIKESIIPVDLDISKSNEYIGTIKTLEPGYIKTSIPYEKSGFELLLNDQKAEIVQVDNAFIGFKVDSGLTKIKLRFEPPYYKLGKIISGFGILILGGIVLQKKKR